MKKSTVSNLLLSLTLCLACVSCQITIPSITTPPVVINPTQPTTPTNNVPVAGKLVDPNPAKYTQEYMDQNGSFEECGIEAQMKIVCRFCVIRGESGGFWMLSSLGMDRVRRGPTGTGVCDDFSIDGYNYHIKGYLDNEPQGNAILTAPVKTDGKYIVVECRKIQ